MQVAAIPLARTLGFVESYDLNPKGRAYYPDVVHALVETCGFLKFPQKIEDFDEQKGVEFTDGKWGDTVIERLVIWGNGIALDTRVSTEESRRVLEDALEWLTRDHGLAYRKGMIKRWGSLSQVTFYSDAKFINIHPALAKLAQQASKANSEAYGEEIRFDFTNLSVGIDTLSRKLALANFLITRRAEAPFSENKYLSEAPLPTALHIKLLEEFEAEVLATSK